MTNQIALLLHCTPGTSRVCLRHRLFGIHGRQPHQCCACSPAASSTLNACRQPVSGLFEKGEAPKSSFKFYRRCLRPLQVIRFGSYTLPVFPEAFLVPADESHIAIATAAVASIAADLGGTELWQSLRIALAPAPLGAAMHYARGRGVDDARGKVAGTPRLLGAGSRAVLVLTDGEVANTRELIDSVRADAAKTGARVHCFGIGTSVSTALVQVSGGHKSKSRTPISYLFPLLVVADMTGPCRQHRRRL